MRKPKRETWKNVSAVICRCFACQDENFSIVRSAKCWLAVEEESLLEAVEQYGFGNWSVTGPRALANRLAAVVTLLNWKIVSCFDIFSLRFQLDILKE